jgi:hypothetical protein
LVAAIGALTAQDVYPRVLQFLRSPLLQGAVLDSLAELHRRLLAAQVLCVFVCGWV